MSTRVGITSIIFGSLISLFGSVFQFALMFLLIAEYGSQFTGFIKNIMNIVVFIGSTESGLCILCAVMLYKPLLKKDWIQANELVSTTYYKNRTVGYTSIGILVGIIIVYGLYVQFVQGGIQVLYNDQTTALNLGFIFLIIFLIGSKNLISFFFTGAYESLMIAGQNNYLRQISFLITDLLVYSLIFYLISLRVNPALLFLPFLAYSIIKVVLITIFIKKRYPWLKLNKRQLNWKLVKLSTAVSLKGLGQALLINTDIIIVSLVINLQVSTILSLYMTISFGVRGIMLLFINSFKEFFASWIANSGRVEWDSYRKFELYSYMIAAFTFTNQFVSSPYFINALFGSASMLKQIDVKDYYNVYASVFLKPDFSLMMAVFSVILVISEPINVLIYAKGYYAKTAFWELAFGIINVVLCVIFAICFKFIGHDLIWALYSIIIVNIAVLAVRFGYLWVFNRIYLTYNASFTGAFKNLLVLLIPVLISILVVYLVLYPSSAYSYQADPHAQQGFNYSMMLDWTVAKLIKFFIVVLVISAVGISLVGLVVSPKLIWGIIRRLPIIYYLLNKLVYKNKKPDVELFTDDLRGFIENRSKKHPFAGTDTLHPVENEVYTIKGPWPSKSSK